MARKPPVEIKVDTFGDHQVISQPNPLRKMVRYSEEKDLDDPVARGRTGARQPVRRVQ